MRLTVLALLGAFMLSLGALAAEWPRFRGPFDDGISRETGINKDWAARLPNQLWNAPMSDGGYAGPSVAAGKIFIIDHAGSKDIVRALKLATGETVWTYEYEDTASNNYGFSQATPLYDNGKLYTISCMGKVFCLNAETGEKIWGANLVADFGGRLPSWRMATSPFIDGDRLILIPGAPNNGAVVALNKTTGQLLWKGGGSDIPGYATPVVATIQGVKQYVIFSGTSLNGVETETGKLLWSFPWKTQHDVNAALPLVAGNSIFITSNYRRGCALVEITPDGPVKAWENTNMHSHFSTPVVIDNLIYGTTDPGKLVCLDPRNEGKIVWEQRGFGKGGLIAVDGVLLVLDGNNGDLAMVKATPEAYQELGRFRPLGGQSWTAPIVADGKLIIRNQKTLAVYDLK